MPQILSRNTLRSRRIYASRGRRSADFSMGSRRGSNEHAYNRSRAATRFHQSATPTGSLSSRTKASGEEMTLSRRSSNSLGGFRSQKFRLGSETQLFLKGEVTLAEEDGWGQFIDVAEADQEITRHSRILSAKDRSWSDSSPSF